MDVYSIFELRAVPENLYGNWINLQVPDASADEARKILLGAVRQTVRERHVRVTNFRWVQKPGVIAYKFVGLPLQWK